MRLAWVLSLGAVAGCGLYFGDSSSAGEADPCMAAYDPSALPLRDPTTGQCTDYSGGSRDGCTTEGFGSPSPGAYPDWGSCSSFCEAFDETSCLAADGCRAVYVTYATDGPSGGVRAFAACWSTAQSGPLRGGVCEGLDAQECSRYDDCSAVHTNADGVPGAFSSCIDETICDPSANQDVPLLRNPESGACEYGAGGGGLDPCSTADLGGAPAPLADWGSCGSFCEGLGEAECKAADGCRAVLADTCSPAAGCTSIAFVACWPIAPSGPLAPGGCAGLASYECSLHNDCAALHARDWSSCPDPSTCTPVVTTFLACQTEAP